MGAGAAAIARKCALTWRCGRAESLDSDWSPEGSETLSTSSDSLSDVASGEDAPAGDVHAGAPADSANRTSLAHDARARGQAAMPLHTGAADGRAAAEDEGQTGGGGARGLAPLSAAASGTATGQREERREGGRKVKGDVATSMERFAVVAALRKFAGGRPWLEKVVTDAACSMELLSTLHEHILSSERACILGLGDEGGREGSREEEMLGFVPSAEYLGVREGMLFREGVWGLGYYPLARVAGDHGGGWRTGRP